MHLLQVPFQFGSRNLVKLIGAESSIQSIKSELQQDLGLGVGELVLQKFNSDWGEWVDLTEVNDMQNKDKVKVINGSSTTSTPPLVTLNQAIHTEGEFLANRWISLLFDIDIAYPIWWSTFQIHADI